MAQNSPAGDDRRKKDFQNAVTLHRAGRLAEAEAAYKVILLGDPQHAEVVRLLGLVNVSRGNFVQATTLFERATRLRPDSVDAQVGLGNALAAQRKLTEAETAYRRALSLAPNHLEALNNLGNLLQSMRRFGDATTVFRHAIAINPNLAELHNNLGNALQAEKNPDEALACYRTAITLKPDFAEAHSNLGNILKARNELTEAVASYRRALVLNPKYVDALNNMGNALHAQGNSAEAILAYQRSRELQPQQGGAYFYESLVQLTLGNLPDGFAKYEYRWLSDLRGAQRQFPQPLWTGDQEINGKVLLLHAEQGLGDTLHFVRYASAVARRGANVILEVQPALKSFLAGVPGVQAIFAKGETLPPFDLHCPLLSLPRAFRTDLGNIPPPADGLVVAAERTAHWKSKLEAETHPKIGLMWSGNPHHNNDRNRSVPLERLRPLIEENRASFYSLQKEYRSAADRALALELGVKDLSTEIDDFENTAALIKNLDLVISVDTSMAHLAGSLGKQVWVLLPFCPDWRWMLQRSDTPWYPSMRLFRQDRPGDWTKVLADLSAALTALSVE